MPQITDESKLINALRAAPPNRVYQKASVTSEGAGTFQSLWKVVGTPGAGANPPLFTAGAGYTPTKDTLGAYGFNNAISNGSNALLKLSFASTIAGALFAYDRIWACSGFGTVVTTLQSVTTPGALPVGRDPNNGLDVEPWLEIYAAPGATAATWTLTGTDGLGNTGRTWIYAHPANAETVGQMAPFVPGGATPAAVASIRQVTGFTCSVTSGLAGDVGVTLMRRLSESNAVAANIGVVSDALMTSMPPVYNDACVALMTLCTTTATGLALGSIVIGESPT